MGSSVHHCIHCSLLYSLFTTVSILCTLLYSLYWVHHCTLLYSMYCIQVVSSCSKVDCWAVDRLSNCIIVSNLNVVLNFLNATLRASVAATQYVYKFIAPGVKIIVDCLQVARSLTSRNWNWHKTPSPSPDPSMPLWKLRPPLTWMDPSR